MQRRPFAVAGAIVSFTAAVLAYYAPATVMHRNIGAVTPILRDNFWLAVHVVTIMASYASAAIALILGCIALGYYLFGRYRDESNMRRRPPEACRSPGGVHLHGDSNHGPVAGRRHDPRRPLGRQSLGAFLELGSERGLGADFAAGVSPDPSPPLSHPSRAISRLVGRLRHGRGGRLRIHGHPLHLVRRQFRVGKRDALLRFRQRRAVGRGRRGGDRVALSVRRRRAPPAEICSSSYQTSPQTVRRTRNLGRLLNYVRRNIMRRFAKLLGFVVRVADRSRRRRGRRGFQADLRRQNASRLGGQSQTLARRRRHDHRRRRTAENPARTTRF